MEVVLRIGIFVMMSLLISLPIIGLICYAILDRVKVPAWIHYTIIVVTFLLSSAFITIPLTKKIVTRFEIKSQVRDNSSWKIEWLEECINDYLDDNSLYLSNDKIHDIAEFIYEKGLYVDDDDYGFFIEDDYLEFIGFLAEGIEEADSEDDDSNW